MARDLLPVSGTNVPVESLFSGGPDILSHRRKSLLPETVKRLLCLKNWLQRKEEPSGLAALYMKAVREKILDEDSDTNDEFADEAEQS